LESNKIKIEEKKDNDDNTAIDSKDNDNVILDNIDTVIITAGFDHSYNENKKINDNNDTNIIIDDNESIKRNKCSNYQKISELKKGKEHNNTINKREINEHKKNHRCLINTLYFNHNKKEK